MSKVIAQNFGGGGKILMGGKDYVTVWKKKDYHAITCHIWPAKSVTLSDIYLIIWLNGMKIYIFWLIITLV